MTLTASNEIRSHAFLANAKLKQVREIIRLNLYAENGLLTKKGHCRPLTELMSGAGFGDNAAMLCGTLSAIGGVRPATEYKMSLEDPVRKKTIELSYKVNLLPEIA